MGTWILPQLCGPSTEFHIKQSLGKTRKQPVGRMMRWCQQFSLFLTHPHPLGCPCCSFPISVPASSLLLPGEVSSAVVPPMMNMYILSPYEKYPYAAAQPEIWKQKLFLHELKQSFGGFYVVQVLPLTGKCRMGGSWAKSFTNMQQNKTPAKIFQIYDVIYLHLKTTPTWWHLNHVSLYNRDFPSSTSIQFILQCSGVRTLFKTFMKLVSKTYAHYVNLYEFSGTKSCTIMLILLKTHICMYRCVCVSSCNDTVSVWNPAHCCQ